MLRSKGKLFFLALVALCGMASLSAMAADKPKSVKYQPPPGFAGHKWGDLLTSFDRLGKEPFSVGAAWSKAVMTDIDFQCVSGVGAQDGAMGACDLLQTLRTVRKKFEGGGFYVLSEYRIEQQGFRFGSDGVLLYPVIYQFCANWDETKKELPPDFDTLNQFCGMRLLFKTESRAELAQLPGDHVTAYERVLEELIAKFGRPEGFLRRGRVVIETMDGESSDASDRRFSIWRWCPARDRGLHTGCDASVTLSVDPASGRGTVLYSTPLLWEYAYARENGAFKGDPLFRMLHARQLERPPNNQFRMR